jgi:hypothetical protein
MSSPFPVIPADAIPFFVRDSYSLTMTPGPGGPAYPMVHNPGAASQRQAIVGNNVPVTAWFKRGLFQLIACPGGQQTLFAVDAGLQFYDMASGAAVPTGVMLTFGPIMSGPTFNGWVMHHSSNPTCDAPTNWEYGDMPIDLKGVTPATGGPFRIGPVIQFHSGLTANQVFHYTYMMCGAWKV